jgi:hypothetical protein
MIAVVVDKLSRRLVPNELWALLDELGGWGLIDWSRAVVDGLLCKYATVTAAISCGGCRA